MDGKLDVSLDDLYFEVKFFVVYEMRKVSTLKPSNFIVSLVCTFTFDRCFISQTYDYVVYV